MNKKYNYKYIFIAFIFVLCTCLFGCGTTDANTYEVDVPIISDTQNTTKEIKIMASGDMLYHMPVVYAAKQADGSYNFNSMYDQIKPLISSADLAIGDFEGSICEDKPLSGFPRFNCPSQTADAAKYAGYDVMSLAQNHILDNGIRGALNTKKIYEDLGIDVIGLKDNKDSGVLVKDVNGIKVAVIGLCYGFNGMEGAVSADDYNNHMETFNESYVESRIKQASEVSDVVVVMPHGGVEYRLDPTREQISLYHKMVEWGADVVFGGHPHVPEPCEVIQRDGKDKFIIYSMGNLLSNQRIETIDNKWSERGVIVEVNIVKDNTDISISSVVLHPTWVDKSSSGYKILLAEKYMPNQSNEKDISGDKKSRIQGSYTETLELLKPDSNLVVAPIR